jgi:hypothetical protein
VLWFAAKARLKGRMPSAKLAGRDNMHDDDAISGLGLGFGDVPRNDSKNDSELISSCKPQRHFRSSLNYQKCSSHSTAATRTGRRDSGTGSSCLA